MPFSVSCMSCSEVFTPSFILGIDPEEDLILEPMIDSKRRVEKLRRNKKAFTQPAWKLHDENAKLEDRG